MGFDRDHLDGILSASEAVTWRILVEILARVALSLSKLSSSRHPHSDQYVATGRRRTQLIVPPISRYLSTSGLRVGGQFIYEDTRQCLRGFGEFSHYHHHLPMRRFLCFESQF